MNTQTQEALNMAIEALQNIDNWLPTIGQRGLRDYEADALDACKEALEQPAQEPVAWIDEANNTVATVQLMKYGWLGSDNRAIPDAWIKLYTHPHQWQGLTDDEVDDFMFQSCDAENGYSITDLIRLVEQALKEKNT